MENFKVLVQVGQVDANNTPVQTVVNFGDEWPTKYEFNYGGATEEGYSYTAMTVGISEKDPSLLEMEVYRTSRDCDGPIETWTNMVASISGIKDMVANWTLEHSRQRDQFAEQMNY